MSYPAAVKTWQFSVNNTVVTSTNATTQGARSINKIVKLMQSVGTNPWVAITSSNAGTSTAGGPNVANDVAHGGGGGVGSGDRWTLDSNVLTSGADPDGAGPLLPPITIDNDVNFANAGSRHSWIVLRQTGLATNFEVCFDLASTTAGSGVILFSPSAGFTGGTVTDRPSATDEVYLMGGSAAATIVPATNTQRVFHYTQSTDGQCSRLWVYQAGINIFFCLFDKAAHPVSGWTNPTFAFAESTTTAPDTTNVATFANFAGTRRFRSRWGTNAGDVMLVGCTAEYYASGTALRAATGIGSAVNTFSSEWPVLPIGIAAYGNATAFGGSSGTASASQLAGGRLGNVFDMWWRPSGVALGDTFPNNAATRQYMSLGEIVVPWKGDATTLTTT